jgi:aldehyde dehydrogenase (NAD+)
MSDLPVYQMFVGGEHVPSASGKTFEIENPARGEAIALVSEGDEKDVDSAVRVATEAFRSWADISR